MIRRFGLAALCFCAAVVSLPTWARAVSAAENEATLTRIYNSTGTPAGTKNLIDEIRRRRQARQARIAAGLNSLASSAGATSSSGTATVSVNIRPGIGGLLSRGDMVLSIPPTAVSTPTIVSAAAPDPAQAAARQSALAQAHLTPVSMPDTLSPADLVFESSATLVFSFSTMTVSGTSSSGLSIFAWTPPTWTPLKTKIDILRKTAATRISAAMTVQLLNIQNSPTSTK